MTVRKYLILLAVAIFAIVRRCLPGARNAGFRRRHYRQLASAARRPCCNPWIVVGICLLILFFCSYLTALSWADLTYVLPATALSYVLMALLAKIFLHENVTLSRWLGIALITAGVGFVATGPPLTEPARQVQRRIRIRSNPCRFTQGLEERSMTRQPSGPGSPSIVLTATRETCCSRAR